MHPFCFVVLQSVGFHYNICYCIYIYGCWCVDGERVPAFHLYIARRSQLCSRPRAGAWGRAAEWIRLSHASHTTTKCQSHASHGFWQPNKMSLGDAQAARLSHEACPAGRQVGGEEGHDQGQGQGLGEVDPSLLALETDLSRVRDLILSRVPGTRISHTTSWWSVDEVWWTLRVMKFRWCFKKRWFR